ncbi:hypothetical protein [Bradyrhizobium sp.]
MFKRFLFCLPIVASFTTALAQAPALPPAILGTPGGPILPIVPPPPNNPCDCCAAKPQYRDTKWSPFIGTVAVVTQRQPGDLGPLPNQVVMIWDLHIKNGAPLNSWWNPTSLPPTNYYSDPRWTDGFLGDVFGETLDGKGNIYVAATTVYGTGKVGSLATASTNPPKAGQIYKLANFTGTPTAFVQLPNDGNGIGNIYYDCEFDSLYATNFYDGLIYRINAAGNIQPIQWDHGANLPSATDAAGNSLGRNAIPLAAKDSGSSFTALGRRVWAVTGYKNRLWYSVWGNYPGHNAGPNVANEIYSVALDTNGDPWGSARLEIVLPPFAGGFSYPVSDIAFGPLGTLMVAERTMTGNNSSYAHSSRALEYSFNGTAWVLANPTAYQIGVINSLTNSAGGVGTDFSPGGRTWVTGDALHFTGGDFIYGMQGFPQGGGDITNSILIDSGNYVGNANKIQIGVVRIPCPDCANPPTPPVVVGPRSACVSPSNYSVTPQAGVTYTWTVTGGTPSTATGSAINVNWTGGPGTIMVTTSGPNTCGAVSSFVNVAACSTTCEFCTQFKTNVTLANPVSLGGGLQGVTPTVTSTMSGVHSITTTLLSTSVGYSPASCGVAGPLASYIAQAFPSANTNLNPPVLPVPNGNQAIWLAPSVVPLNAGGATLPFQLKLPPPPTLPPACSANFSLCLRVSLATATCQNCDQMQCFGPFAYSTGISNPNNPLGIADTNPLKFVPLVVPDTRVVPDGGPPAR